MRIALTERFQSEVRTLDVAQRAAVVDVMLALPVAIGRPHVHAGTGIRKLHRSGIFEARAGLSLRLVFTFADGTLTLVTVGSHDHVRRFLKSL